jgi:hypothetical protein
MPNDILSVYLQTHFIICLYVLLVGAAGYGSYSAIEFFKDLLFPAIRPALPPPLTAQPLWHMTGWYRTGPQAFAPLYRNPHHNEWVYVHKGTLVHPTMAGIRRRGIPHLPE